MGDYIFEVADKSGRNIRLTKKVWSKIRKKHYEVEEIDEVIEALTNPDKINSYDESVGYYYKYYKNRSIPKRFLLVIVKYLNGGGFVMSAYYVDKIM